MRKRSGPTPEQMELARILSLPVEEMLSPEELEIFSFDHMLAPAYDAGERLLLEQATAMNAYERHGGGLLPMAVGKGKTGVVLFAVNHAYGQGIRKSLILMPVQNVGSLLNRHIPEWRRRIGLSVPFHFLAGRDATARKAIAESDAPGCYVMPFSLLSCTDTIEVLAAIAPELVVVDEVQNLKLVRSARTKRAMRYVRDAGPQFVGLSGTITQKYLLDYWHLISAALDDNSPLPRTNRMTAEWDSVINAEAGDPDGPAAVGMIPLLDWARDQTGEKFDSNDIESYRRAFRHRLVTAPGVVSSHEEDLGVSLTFRNTPVEGHETCEGWDDLKRFMDDVENFTTPQGEELAHAFHKYKWMVELSAGFYNLLEWPTPAQLAKNRHLDEATAESVLNLAQLHHQAQQAHYSWLRKWFKTSPPGLDTPREVGHALMLAEQRGKPNRKIPIPVAETWHDMKALERVCKEKFGFLPERLRRPVRVCDYKIRHAVGWARKNERGIMWVGNREVGRWLIEALVEAGLEPVHCPAGPEFNRLIESIGDPELGGKGDRIVVASIPAHGVGKNLQAFDRAYYVQWPRSGEKGEQSVGRIHRYGQLADHVEITSCLTTEFDHVVRGACLNDATYVQQTTGAPQKVIFGDYDPLPQVYSEQFLREQGIENVQSLGAEGRRIRTENFGASSR